MKLTVVAFSIFVISIIGIMVVWNNTPSSQEEMVVLMPQEEGKDGMQIRSSAFEHNGHIPVKYTCDGENINPPLQISDVPEGAKSLVLIMDDPDAPRGTWVHWTMWSISPQTIEISENSVPEGAVEGVTSFGRPGYGGPCPPSGTHRYFFKLYALDTVLDLAPDAEKSKLESAMEGHMLDRSELIGLYSRK